MTYQVHNSTLDGLPVSFVNSLKTLFNILDENGTGYIGIGEIESRWQDGEVDGLPTGVIEALRKVTPQSGKLSFDRFVAGLKVALLRHRNLSGSQPTPNLSSRSTPNFSQIRKSNDVQPPKSSAFYPVQNQRNEKPPAGSLKHSAHSAGQLGSNNKLVQQRTSSMPLLQNGINTKHEDQVPMLYNTKEATRGSIAAYSTEYQMSKDKWDRKPGDGRSSVATSSALEFMNKKFMDKQNGQADPVNGSKRRETRRHTLSSGLDNNMMRRLKLLEQERETLNQGLDVVNSTKQWYEDRLRIVQEKQQSIGRNDNPNDHLFEAQQERINLQMVRIQELNQQLKALMESPSKGFPLHMNLAVKQSPHRSEISEKDNTIMMLKSQNRLLTQEVGQRTNQIEQLEREKAQLIQKMFNNSAESPRHTPYKSHDETTFI